MSISQAFAPFPQALRNHHGQDMGPPPKPEPEAEPEGSIPKMEDLHDWVATAEKMQRDLDIRDRTFHLKKWKQCFVGCEAVDWMVKHLKVDRATATLYGNEMMQHGLFYHVKHRHAFTDKPYFYRFLDIDSASDTETEAGSVLSDQDAVLEAAYENLWTKKTPGQPLKRMRSSKWTLASDVTRLQRRVAELASDLEDQKNVTGALFDALGEQLKLAQQTTAIQVDKLGMVLARLHTLEVRWKLLLCAQLVTAVLLVASFAAFLPRPVAALLCAAPVLGGWLWRDRLLYLLEACKREAEPLQALAQAEVEVDLPIWRGNSGFAHIVREAAPESARQRSSTGIDGDKDLHAAMDAAKAHVAEERPSSRRRRQGLPPSEEDFGAGNPLLVRARELPYQSLGDAVQDDGRVPFNTGRPIPVETDVFKGMVMLWVANVPGAPQGLFSGQRRKTAVIVQGRFKRPLQLEDVITGQEFARPATNLPARWLVETVLVKMAQRISPSMSIGPMSMPYVLVPLLAMAQEVNVSTEGSQPDPTRPFLEDMRLFDPALSSKSGEPLPAGKRKQHFWSPKNRAGRTFDTQNVWTFNIYQHQVDMGAYELDMVYRFDLCRHLDGQPLQFMILDKASGEYLFNFEVWHRKLLPAARKQSKRSL